MSRWRPNANAADYQFPQPNTSYEFPSETPSEIQPPEYYYPESQAPKPQDTVDAGGWVELLCMQAGSPDMRGATPPDPVTALEFDARAELIWTGSGMGFLHAHVPEDLRRFSSTPTNEDLVEVRDIAAAPSFGAVVATSRGVRWFRRGGVPVGQVDDPSAVSDARVVRLNPLNDSQCFVAGGGANMAILDLVRGRVLQQTALTGVVAAGGVTSAAWPTESSFLITATAGGRLSLRNPTSLRETSSVTALTGAPTAIASSGNYIAVSGLTTSAGLSYMDHTVRVFDLRQISKQSTPVATVAFPAGGWRIAFDTTSNGPNTTALWCLSAEGMLQAFDISSAASTTHVAESIVGPIQLDAGTDTFTDLLSSDNGLLVASDTGGFVHQWAKHDNACIHIEPEPLPTPVYDGTAPAVRPQTATIQRNSGVYGRPQMTAAKGTLQYALESEMGGTVIVPRVAEADEGQMLTGMTDLIPSRKPFSGKPRRIDPKILQTTQKQDWVPYAPAPPGYVRNSPMGYVMDGKHNKQAVEDSEIMYPAFERYKFTPMDLVAHQGIEGFNFSRYNSSNSFCGLQNALPNSYANSVVHMLFFIAPLRKAVMSHSCDHELCLTCELGFLFHMLSTGGRNVACESSNFTRTLVKTPNAAALGLLDRRGASAKTQDPSRIENFLRYLLEQVNRNEECSESIISVLFGCDTLTTGRYGNTQFVQERKDRIFQHALSYDRVDEHDDFATLLQTSLRKEIDPVRAFCNPTGQFMQLYQSRKLLNLPNMLVLGCHSGSEKYIKFWCGEVSKHESSDPVAEARRKLPLWLKIEADADAKSSLAVEALDEEPSPEEMAVTKNDHRAVYALDCVVAFVTTSSHWIANVRVPREDRQREVASEEWWCFNDFTIAPCDGAEEATSFHQKWKLPCIVLYSRVDVSARIPEIDDSRKMLEPFTYLQSAANAAVALTPDELSVLRGFPVALDCEFVCIDREEFEIENMKRRILVPAKMALARVSVLRGAGPRAGVPFIDDYISIQDPVVDYLTRWSGLKAGDLDPGTSKHTLITLKEVYKKLLCLLDCGCVLVGHGLKADFRIINFLVPPEQVVDTVELFRQPSMRFLSLRYLSSALLGTRIQTQTHDSVEDADAARQLYDLYRELQANRTFEPTLSALYSYGRKNGWAVNPEQPFTVPYED